MRLHPAIAILLAAQPVAMLIAHPTVVPTAPSIRHASATPVTSRAVRSRPLLAVEVPRDLDSVVDLARNSVTAALLSGKRGLRVEAGAPCLDAASSAYEPAALARFSLELMHSLTILDGPLLLLLPGLQAVSEATSMLDSQPAELRERIQVSALGLLGGPDDGAPDERPKPAGVVIAGLLPAADADDSSMRHARAWLRLASTGRAATICLNARVRLLPVEMASYVTAFALVPYTIARAPTKRAGEAVSAGNVLLMRTYPGQWKVRPLPPPPPPFPRDRFTRWPNTILDAAGRKQVALTLMLTLSPAAGRAQVLLDAGGGGEYETLDAREERPDDKTISEMLLPTVRARKAALDSALRALQPGGGTGEGGAKEDGANEGGGASHSRCPTATNSDSSLIRDSGDSRQPGGAAGESGSARGAGRPRGNVVRGGVVRASGSAPGGAPGESGSGVGEPPAASGDRSIGDVVGGLHGSKYQFGAPGFGARAGGLEHRGVEGASIPQHAPRTIPLSPPRHHSPLDTAPPRTLSAEGAQFAEALASSGSNGASDGVDGGDESGERPSWAMNLKPSASADGTLKFRQRGVSLSVRITNVYRAWEKYYAAILPEEPLEAGSTDDLVDLGADFGFEVAISSGVLAPRGGANNVCDPSKPYRCVRVLEGACGFVRERVGACGWGIRPVGWRRARASHLSLDHPALSPHRCLHQLNSSPLATHPSSLPAHRSPRTALQRLH